MRLTSLHDSEVLTFTITRGAVAFVCSLIAGCSGEDGATDPHGGIALEDAPAEIAKAVCPRAYDCCTTAQLARNDQAGTDEPSCEVKTAQGFRNHLGTIESSQRKGRVVYRGDKLADCLAYVRSASCGELNRTNHFSGLACEPYTEPKVPPGELCAHDFECIGGTCEKASGAAEGTCQAGSPPPPVTAVRGTAPVGSEMCFYSSACAFGRGQRSGGLLVLLMTSLLALGVRRRRIRGREKLSRTAGA